MSGYQFVQGVNGYSNNPTMAGGVLPGVTPGQGAPVVGANGQPNYAQGFAPQSTAGQQAGNPFLLQYGPQAMQAYTQNATYAGPAAGYINNYSIGGPNGPANSLNSTMGGLDRDQINSLNGYMGGRQIGSQGQGTGLGAGAYDVYGFLPGQTSALGNVYSAGGHQYNQGQLQGVLNQYNQTIQGIPQFYNTPSMSTNGTPLSNVSNLGQMYGELAGNPFLKNYGANTFAGLSPQTQQYFGNFYGDSSMGMYNPAQGSDNGLGGQNTGAAAIPTVQTRNPTSYTAGMI